MIARFLETFFRFRLLILLPAVITPLVVVPFAIGLPGKTAAGQRMLNDFHPLMQPANVQTTANYYYKTFVPLGAPSIGSTAQRPLTVVQPSMPPRSKSNVSVVALSATVSSAGAASAGRGRPVALG